MPSLYLLYRLDGRTVVADALKLEIKVVKSGDELRLRRVASDNDGLLVEDSFNNKTTPVMLQSGFAEQLAKADVLLFIKPERVFITRRSGLLIGLVCRVSVHIHIWLKKGSRLGSDPGLAEREPLSDKPKFVGQRYSSLPSGDGKNPRRRISDRSSENPPLRLPGGSVPGAILQPFRDCPVLKKVYSD